MRPGKKLIAALVTLAICLTILIPMPARAAEITFTAINERVLALNADTMPIWSGDELYVPYTTFDATENGMRWSISCSYARTSGMITVFDIDQRMFLEFDLREGTCHDGLTGEEFSPGAILRGSRPYLPVKVVCDYFDLDYSYREISQGNLLRIKNEDVVLSDSKFVDAATNALNLRLREYNQQNMVETPETTPTVPDDPGQNREDEELSVDTYLAFRCEEAGQIANLLYMLESRGVHALFFVTPEVAQQRGDLILWMLGAGHSVGLLAQGETPEETGQILAQGSRALEQQAFLRTTVACVPEEQRDELEQEHWICWDGTLDLTPGDGDGPSYFARRTLGRLNGRTRTTYLSLSVNANTLRVLPTLLTQLEEAGYNLTLPLETRL